MTDEIKGGEKMPGKDAAIAKKETGGGLKKHVKKAAKHAMKKDAARKHAKKVVKSVGRKSAMTKVAYALDHGQMTAFHHMQRASIVMSLMEKGTGKDLRNLLERGVKLYRRAMEDEAR